MLGGFYGAVYLQYGNERCFSCGKDGNTPKCISRSSAISFNHISLNTFIGINSKCNQWKIWKINEFAKLPFPTTETYSYRIDWVQTMQMRAKKK